ncbi:MAG: hypothetical protein HOB84_06145 [Candidatus Marinimicrobia bacterium]|nr:hypothetical protein [Candidatus Neomarinimicrobiota bacterium]MBT4361576.1 hypothetical protein [Candidatus Neomarinimicrobiota bacterium]MBT4714333.1 hypothetical protein [Candidatus Neomarinimicrobiota bacterium]MBT4945577.1 hypothetical protein [Candidatus Neomarinimicrobiota bacterium]MBT5271583.1 hypothetical protein [Candidatus Neomarinimicrobiota bacterium]
MADNNSYTKKSSSDVDPWLIWFTFFASALVFTSLFIVSSSMWHIGIIVLTLGVLWTTSPSPLRTLAFILGLVLFLALLQIIFSPFMRDLFLKSLEKGFLWSDWQYLLFAVERFAWPLVIVSSFQSRLSNPATIAQLTILLSPLKWLGFQIGKLQTLVVLSLRFIPSLKMEWQRFSRFQLYFVSGSPRKTYLQRLRFWQGVFKALIAQTIHRSMTLGDLLAIRGLPTVKSNITSKYMLLLSCAWLSIGLIFLALDETMIIIWSIMTIWMGLVTLARKQEVII